MHAGRVGLGNHVIPEDRSVTRDRFVDERNALERMEHIQASRIIGRESAPEILDGGGSGIRCTA